MAKGHKARGDQSGINVHVKTTTRFECEFLGYSIYIFKRKEDLFASLVISQDDQIVLANTDKFNNFDEAVEFTIKSIFS